MIEKLLSEVEVSAEVDSVPRLVFDASKKHKNLIAIEDGEFIVSYAQLPEYCLNVSRAIMASGISKGDKVAIWAGNSGRWILAAIGLQMAGAVLVPINTRMKPIEANEIIQRSGAKLVFSEGDFLSIDYAAGLLEVMDSDKAHVVTLTARKGPDLKYCTDWEGFLKTGEKVDVREALSFALSITGEDLADLMFTSGTTGKPKGVMSKHGAMIKAFTIFINTLGIGPKDRYLVVNPFFHSFGYKAGWVASLLAGATVLPQSVFDAQQVLKRINDDEISVLPGPPTLYLSLLADPNLKHANLSTLRVAVTGASTIPPILIEKMKNELGFKVVSTAYGLTECGGLASICDVNTDINTIANTSGKAIEDTEIAILSKDGEHLKAGETGEICIRGFHVMKGYFEQPQATADAIDENGFLHTGDVGHLDENGFLSITDRLKDMYICGGFNCYPAEIEGVLAQHPAIAQSAVVGISDNRMGEVGCAFITLKANHHLDEHTLITWCKERMANYRVPRKVKVIDAMPLNSSNKIIKKELLKFI